MNKQCLTHRPAAAFTLLEVLVSITILSVVLLITVWITSSAQESVEWAGKKIETDTGARQLTRLLDRDLQEMIRRPDAPFEFGKVAGNDGLAFLANRAGYPDGGTSANRGVSLVRYETDGEGRISRGCLGYDFASGAQVPLDPDATLPTVPYANHQSVSDTVFRVEFEFLVEDSNGRTVRQITPPTTISELRGIVISIAVIDSRSRRKIPGGDLTRLADSFADAADGKTPMEDWNETIITNSRQTTAGIPAEVFRSIRVYESTHLFE